MKTKLLITLFYFFLFIVGTSVESFAAESQVIKVSCTIPAIPGVNVPLVDQKEQSTVELQKSDTQNVNRETLKSETDKTLYLAKTEIRDQQKVETVYSR